MLNNLSVLGIPAHTDRYLHRRGRQDLGGVSKYD